MADRQDNRLALGVMVTLGPHAVEKITLAPRDEGFFLSFDGADSPLIKDQVVHWFSLYLEGEAGSVDFPLKMASFPSFSERVLEQMQKIPFGEQKTYAQLAHAAGSPRGARAVGNICRDNPFPLVIPCHRVVGGQGLGGFAFGLAMKRQLLDFEFGLKGLKERTFLGSLGKLAR
ncbi:MAG: Methylated-DNA--protein-cysteine methyltransferase, constitutive [Chlamydiae bacterium]|nr:Methylated-DNA--protein-cysteine methyltransferase, constitutive [Chlamydiota bacterium]